MLKKYLNLKIYMKMRGEKRKKKLSEFVMDIIPVGRDVTLNNGPMFCTFTPPHHTPVKNLPSLITLPSQGLNNSLLSSQETLTILSFFFSLVLRHRVTSLKKKKSQNSNNKRNGYLV